mgnify:CR=1 FL=1
MIKGDLFKYLNKNKCLDENYSTYFCKEMISALIFLYKNDIIHRDIKPENIMIKD